MKLYCRAETKNIVTQQNINNICICLLYCFVCLGYLSSSCQFSIRWTSKAYLAYFISEICILGGIFDIRCRETGKFLRTYDLTYILRAKLYTCIHTRKLFLIKSIFNYSLSRMELIHIFKTFVGRSGLL